MKKSNKEQLTAAQIESLTPLKPSPYANEMAQNEIVKTKKIIEKSKQLQAQATNYTRPKSPQTVPTIEEFINQLARQATVGTLKIIHMASANDKIMQLRIDLQRDFALVDNTDKNTTKNGTISEAYDCFVVAYTYLWEQIAVNQKASIDTITTTMKNGKDKIRTVYQTACSKVRQYIYTNKSIESNGKFVYIEDMKHSEDDTAADVLDREYIKLGKYSHIADDSEYGITANYNAFDVIDSRIDKMDLSDRHKIIIDYRLQGLSITDIAIKLGVNKSSISRNLDTIQKIYTNTFPIID